MARARIAILTLEVDDFVPEYFLSRIAEAWREMDFQVDVVKGLDQPAEADLAVLHTDITTVPFEYLAAVRRYPRTLNGHVADISKRVVSDNLVSRNCDWNRAVIVKANLNACGTREARLAEVGFLDPSFLHRAFDYRVYESPSAVPLDLWTNPNVVVEKFLPERRGSAYCARAWVFLGDRDLVWISYSSHAVVKQASTTRREMLDKVPEELRAKREELAFEFGRFDYVEVDGKAILLDANRTPTLGSLPHDVFVPKLKSLAGGIHEFL